MTIWRYIKQKKMLFNILYIPLQPNSFLSLSLAKLLSFRAKYINAGRFFTALVLQLLSSYRVSKNQWCFKFYFVEKQKIIFCRKTSNKNFPSYKYNPGICTVNTSVEFPMKTLLPDVTNEGNQSLNPPKIRQHQTKALNELFI